MCAQLLSHVRLFATPWTATCQASQSMGFPRQEYWSGLPFPPPRDLPDPGIKPMSPALAGEFFTTELPAAAAAKSLQSCLTLCNPMDCSLPGIYAWDFPGKSTGVGCQCLLPELPGKPLVLFSGLLIHTSGPSSPFWYSHHRIS